jgi:hypothetical protein
VTGKANFTTDQKDDTDQKKPRQISTAEGGVATRTLLIARAIVDIAEIGKTKLLNRKGRKGNSCAR